MARSQMFRIGMVMSVSLWGLASLPVFWSMTQAQEAIRPATETPAEEKRAGESDDHQKSAAELTSLKARVKVLSEALEAKKQELAPHVHEAQTRVQQATAALQKAIGPDESKYLGEELRVAQESLSLLEREIALAEEEVTLAEGMFTVADRKSVV